MNSYVPMVANTQSENSYHFPENELRPVIFRFEDTANMFLRFRVTEVRANGDVVLRAIDMPRFSRVVSKETFQKGIGFMEKHLRELGPVSRAILDFIHPYPQTEFPLLE